MGIFSVLKKIDRALHIDKLRYYVKDKRYSFEQYIAIKKMCNESDFIMINTPDHGNLGDHAIAIAEQNFFNERFPNVRYREVTGDYYRKNSRIIRKVMKTNIVLGISGGGYIGDVWMEEEELVRSVISSFPDNKIIIFPQTVYYSETTNGKMELEKTKKVFLSHKDNLYFFLRESRSYDFIRRAIPELKNVYCYPDMVLSMAVDIKEQRNGILTCFRNDKEKILSTNIIDVINRFASEHLIDIKSTTTVCDYSIDASKRESEVYKKLKEFASAKLIVTDRLHAMLFAAITGTPCIAFDNNTGKIGGVYRWIKDKGFIYFASGEIADGAILAQLDKLLMFQISNPIRDYDWNDFAEEIRVICNY